MAQVLAGVGPWLLLMVVGYGFASRLKRSVAWKRRPPMSEIARCPMKRCRVPHADARSVSPGASALRKRVNW